MCLNICTQSVHVCDVSGSFVKKTIKFLYWTVSVNCESRWLLLFWLWLWCGIDVLLQVSPTDYHRFIYKCHTCLLGFKRRGMLVNHLAKRHPDISPDSVPELNLPILKTTRDYYCQYCEKVSVILVNCWSWCGMRGKVWHFTCAGYNLALNITLEWSVFLFHV